MYIETPIEDLPPISDKLEIPEYAKPFCDNWGNI